MVIDDIEIGMPVKVRKSSYTFAGNKGTVVGFDEQYGLVMVRNDETQDIFYIAPPWLKLRKGIPWIDEEGFKHDGHGGVFVPLQLDDDILLLLAKISVYKNLTISETASIVVKEFIQELAKETDAGVET